MVVAFVGFVGGYGHSLLGPELRFMAGAFAAVIVNLAVFFGYHGLWPQGLAGHVDWGAALIAAGAGVALFKFKRGVIPVIVACALIGLVLKLQG